ncbi:MAG: hypothetical protein N3B13_05490, partial [Deltaproteobacteria bacterium]|nr:hypothetical protein [Deltaproteobacteria bacterium]
AKANQDYKDNTTAAAILYSAGGAYIVGGIISLIFYARKEGEDRVALVSAGEQFFFVYRF